MEIPGQKFRRILDSMERESGGHRHHYEQLREAFGRFLRWYDMYCNDLFLNRPSSRVRLRINLGGDEQEGDHNDLILLGKRLRGEAVHAIQEMSATTWTAHAIKALPQLITFLAFTRQNDPIFRKWPEDQVDRGVYPYFHQARADLARALLQLLQDKQNEEHAMMEALSAEARLVAEMRNPP